MQPKSQEKRSKIMTIDVTKEIKTDELHKGDAVIEGPGGIDRMGNVALFVDHLDRKVKWTTVHFTNTDTTYRRLGDDVWTVVRTEKTEAEKAAEHRALIVDALERSYELLQRVSPRATLQAILDKVTDDTYEVLTWSNLPDVLKAQATHKVALRLRDLVERNDGSILDAFALWYAHQVRELSTGYAKDPTSRSTSVLSNLMEDLDGWAVQSVLTNWDVRYAADVLAERAAEIHAQRAAYKNA